jgi:feruloyl esterase
VPDISQVETVRKIYQGANPDGDQSSRHHARGEAGGEDGTPDHGYRSGRGSHMTLGPSIEEYRLRNPDWDFRTFRFDRVQGIDSDVDFLDYKMGPIINNINPDLRAFQANGGKLIQYHGWADPDISPINSINYYQNVVQFMDRNGRGLSETKSFYRLFMVPGMYHCNGGPGPNTFDA